MQAEHKFSISSKDILKRGDHTATLFMLLHSNKKLHELHGVVWEANTHLVNEKMPVLMEFEIVFTLKTVQSQLKTVQPCTPYFFLVPVFSYVFKMKSFLQAV
jgi:hypothetical protein